MTNEMMKSRTNQKKKKRLVVAVHAAIPFLLFLLIMNMSQYKQHFKHEGLEEFHMNPQLTVFVRDLPYCCDANILQKFLVSQLNRPILRAKVCCNKSGKTLQYAYIMFESEADAAFAVESLQGVRFIGRDLRYLQ
jgi:RNA recognition motif-containing protein